MSAQANNQLLSMMILQLLEEFNKPEEAGGEEVMILQLLQEGNKQEEVGEEKEHQHQQEETKGLRLWDLPGITGERVVSLAVFKCATPTNIDIGYKPRGLKWKGKDVVTTPQL
ncbi:hypothetical protein H5410_054911 [Solanum commersonii]|uniref:Uncharacterized protein n=1 Tax=Solanum commersonii TaxID=4109 RepID=A0A9J5WG67_SOLCO|nr:hypothetical protein H5410_054911 [Solanum commersonii]